LVGGPCLDFNLIVDATRCRADLQVLRLERPWSLPPASSLLIFLAGGVLSVPALDVTLGRHHTLRVEGASAPLETIPGYGGAVLIVVRID
jgi:environmental stress-induced protein Ves